MAITASTARQYPLCARVTFVETDLPLAATAYAALTLPPNAVVIGGHLDIATAFDGGADVTLTVSGGGVSTAALDADAAALHTLVTTTGDAQTAGDTVDITLGGTIGGTAGVASLVIFYIVVGRENEVQDD
jgi:hypothetical protein